MPYLFEGLTDFNDVSIINMRKIMKKGFFFMRG